ncbi:g5574 [Coccomyxa elongata]
MARNKQQTGISKESVKIVLLGEGRVGKTSLLARFIHNNFKEDQQATIQAAFMSRQLQIDSQQVEVALWDTAGQERFHSLAPLYYRDADAALLVYDISDRDTLERVRHWVKELRTMVGDDIVLTIVGNKSDLERERAVSQEEAAAFAQSIGAQHVSASAKTGQGIEAAVSGTAQMVLASRKRLGGSARPPGSTGRRPGSIVIADGPGTRTQGSSCC